MRETTSALIERLTSQAVPIKPLLSPWLRAAALLVPVLGLMTAIALASGNPTRVTDHFSDPVFTLALAGSLLTGIFASVAAFMLSVPGRTESWMWLPAAPGMIWLTASTVQCYRHVEEYGIHDYSPFASADCFVFILMAGTPIAVATHFLLRRALPTNLIGVTALAGLAAAALAAALLAFFHPAGTDPVDFITHLVAVSALVLYMTTLGRNALGSD